MIDEVLIAQNHWLLAKLAKLESAILQSAIPPELKPYHETVLQVCQELSTDITQNLSDLSLGQASIVSEILSNTQACTRVLNLVSTRLAYPLLRASEADRLSLRVIQWMHSEHPETRQVPPAFSMAPRLSGQQSYPSISYHASTAKAYCSNLCCFMNLVTSSMYVTSMKWTIWCGRFSKAFASTFYRRRSEMTATHQNNKSNCKPSWRSGIPGYRNYSVMQLAS